MYDYELTHDNYSHLCAHICIQFIRSTGKSTQETDLWMAYCAFHAGDYVKARTVSDYGRERERERVISVTPPHSGV